ncbi:MAG: hypothetical protein MUC29_13235, partial [Pyrinomonadaceae bacterium]|nr:hypothetical protein [Pyrinomonadaceae bacterium]
GVFLTITDLLGRRTLTHRNYNFRVEYTPDSYEYQAGCPQLNEGIEDYRESGIYINMNSNYSPDGYIYMPEYPNNTCELVDVYTCIDKGKCQSIPLPRTDYDVALNHVTKIYAINGSNGNACGGGEYNRMYFSADDELIYLMRNIQVGLPSWWKSEDLLGPHHPFTQSRETIGGRPKGQLHNWAWDYQAQYMTRPGVYGVYDPHLVEIDIDYNAIHGSNTECYYGGVLGRYKYQSFWWNQGLGGSAELDYTPSNIIEPINDCPSGYTSLGGIISSEPTTSVLDDKVYVFARGTDGAVYYQTSTGSAFSGWQSLGGIINSNPASTSDGTTLWVEGLGTTGLRYYQTTTGSSFSGWTEGSVTVETNPSSILNGVTYNFVKGTSASPSLCYKAE